MGGEHTAGGHGPAGTGPAVAQLPGAQLTGARTAGMTGADGLMAASGSGLVRYALPGRAARDLVGPQLAADADRPGVAAAAGLSG